MIGRLQRRALYAAYYDGVIDSIEHEAPSPGKVQGPSYSRQIERARRQGWYDGRAKRVLRPFQFDASEVLRRAEIREANGGTA